MAKCIMVQGTMSGAGKSLLCAALCRVFRQNGLRVAPFKSQNMALNSFVTPDGLELGRAQAMQAEAAGRECDVRMNPILLKPTGDMGSQLIVMGEVRGQVSAADYQAMKPLLLPEVLAAYRSLSAEYDVIVIEGAGSPAEINLRDHDIVNMGLAQAVDAPVILVGDIDRGGVFAQLYGTVALLETSERERLIGTVINKFRGDASLLTPGLSQLEALTGLPVLGVLPYLDIDLDDEDSLAHRLFRTRAGRPLDVVIVRLPHLSNFTDFAPLEDHPAVGLRYLARVDRLGAPDCLILPGTKTTMDDLKWLHQTGWSDAICALARAGVPVLGVCGGYQMLGEALSDPEGLEGAAPGTLPGLGLLPIHTRFAPRKTRRRREGVVALAEPFAGARFSGYEIHAGETAVLGGTPFCRLEDGSPEGTVSGTVFGTYLHGLFDSGELTKRLVAELADRRGVVLEEEKILPRAAIRQRQYDMLAEAVRRYLDMETIRRAMEAFADD